MRIEVYFQQIRDAIDACPMVQSSNVAYDKRGTYEGFIRAVLLRLGLDAAQGRAGRLRFDGAIVWQEVKKD